MEQRYIVNESGRKTAVVLSLKDYKRLLEDLHDLAVVAERRGEPTVDFRDLKHRLRADGILQD
ncbi:MAG: hypothetical protein HY666_04140 [Chloroflexi bacterium]|nr:hypothetical protein [Chloroflexota bacterium]